MKKIASTLALLFAVSGAAAQGPPPPPPLQPLQPPTAPAGNPVTTDKANLGKALFWDEQLSSTRTISCGTCHQPSSGGSDPRSIVGTTDHPGADGLLGTDDDITGSPGVISNNADGTYAIDDFFGLAIQITGRYAPSAINAGYAEELFWDGRAGETFTDPTTGNTILATGAALESQVAGPPTSPVEMAHANRDWEAIADRIAHVKPLAVSPGIPIDLQTWIADRNYDELFSQAFGSAGVTASRIIMAIATYERTLVSNQAPFDAFIGGNQNALTQQERQGLNLFRTNDCVACHGGNRLTDDRFHYIGVRPQADDLGRFNVTGRNADRGRMKTPTLRNVELRGEFMHNGRLQSLAEVVDFYDRGGDFDAPNKNNNIRPLNLTDVEKAALVAFLGRPLTDPRVAAETGLFSRPALFADSPLQPVIGTDGVADIDGNTPSMIAIEPSLSGNPNFTVGLESTGSGRTAYLALDTAPIPTATYPNIDDITMFLEFTTDDDGHVSATIPIPGGDALNDATLHGRWFMGGEGDAPDGVSPSFSVSVFGASAGLLLAPTNLTGTYSDDTGNVELSWSAVADADFYEIFRGSSHLFEDANRLGSSNSTAFTDDSVDESETYQYWVFAVNEHEASAVSEPASVATIDLTGFTLNVTDGTSTANTSLSWPAQGPAISYRVLRGLEPDPATFVQIADGLTELSYDDTTGDAARTYYYRVLVLVGGNPVDNSEVAAGSRGLAAPTNVAASDSTFDDRIRITWTGVDEADSYEVYRSELFGPETLLATISSTTYDDFGATPAENFIYSLRSVNEYGFSARSETDEGYRQVQAPVGVSATNATFSDRIVIAWNPAESVDSYRIYRSTTGSFADAVLLDTVSGASSFSDFTAASGTNYTYWVASVDEGGNSIVNGAGGAIGLSAETTPDAMIGKNGGSVKGNDIYNTTGTGQQHNASSKRYRTAKATLATQNDGSIPDVLRYTASGNDRKFDIKYIRLSPASTNLTAAMKTGAATSADLAPGSGEQITIKAKPKRSKTRNSRKTFRYNGAITSTSTTNPEKVDCVKLKVTSSK